jgi:hypothetical protein
VKLRKLSTPRTHRHPEWCLRQTLQGKFQIHQRTADSARGATSGYIPVVVAKSCVPFTLTCGLSSVAQHSNRDREQMVNSNRRIMDLRASFESRPRVISGRFLGDQADMICFHRGPSRHEGPQGTGERDLDNLIGFEVDLSSHVLIRTGSLEDDPIEPERGKALIGTGAGSAGVSLPGHSRWL